MNKKIVKDQQTDASAELSYEEHLDISKNTTIVNRRFRNLSFLKEEAEGLTFKNCEIVDSKFNGSCLNKLTFEDCIIYNCDFRNADIQDGIFKNCSFYEKEKQIGCSFREANLQRAEFHNCDISTNDFQQADVFQIVIDNSRAQGCNFNMTNFSKVVSRTFIFSAAYLTNTDFRYADFSNVHLKKCDLSNSRFVTTIFSRANLDESDLRNSIFAPEKYDGLSLCDADLRNADIRNLDIRALDFAGVKIQAWQQAFFMENLGIIVFPD